MRESAFTWVRRAAVTLAVFVPAAIAVLWTSIQISSQPRFCGSCHYMTPYYRSWLTSTHREVACVECHIPPGMVSEFRKKYEALAMVARYFTGTYSTNPWAEVDDQSCLRSGCHAKRVLLGREVYQGVLFDHQPHLAEMRREKRLRCTSCHSQIVQGSHMAVTTSTCILCHFKNTPLNQGTARCTLCHEVPEKTITTAGLSFDHGDVKRFDMSCTLCHEGVVRGTGEVPRERCYTCHNDAPRLSRLGETEFLHQEHVTAHKVECLNCHVEMVHRIPAREEALATACEACHSPAAGHSATRDLYRGIGGKGVNPRPAAMYLAGVRCEACHQGGRADSGPPDEVSCMSCHGPKYLTIYQTWRVGLEKRIEGVRSEIREASKHASGALMDEAAANLALVEQGKGMHNPPYALDLLGRAHRDVVAALEGAGKAAPRDLPWTQAPYEAECLGCHFGIEYVSRPAFGREFPHRTHVVSARLRCVVCHGGQDRHGELELAADDCERCHTRIRKPMAGVTAEDCLACHTADIGQGSGKATFPHQRHVELGVDCALCHDGVTEQPHVRFARSPTARPGLGHAFCAGCHAADVPSDDGVPDGADCTKCHVDL